MARPSYSPEPSHSTDSAARKVSVTGVFFGKVSEATTKRSWKRLLVLAETAPGKLVASTRWASAETWLASEPRSVQANAPASE
ncbi:hypothetical protein [Nannocystis pusilla]|uniref:hypothetical protein n=1 Tax=Nannocystis pusilla TaxID=889268 RepID=UPI003DA23D3D